MLDMWKNRAPPTPLDFEGISEGSFILPSVVNGQSPAVSSKPAHGNVLNGSSKTISTSKLKDQKELSLQENLVLFISRCVRVSYQFYRARAKGVFVSTHRLAARLRAGEETISFDKDDDDTLDFVTAASNLRSVAYGISGKSRWEIKGAPRIFNLVPGLWLMKTFQRWPVISSQRLQLPTPSLQE
jgi:ubiquitin-like 1-activating enzyme E1 B